MQIIHSIRILPRFLVFTVAIVGVVIVIPMTVDQSQLQGWGGMAWMLGLNAYADFLLLLQLPVGFLGPPAQRLCSSHCPFETGQLLSGN